MVGVRSGIVQNYLVETIKSNRYANLILERILENLRLDNTSQGLHHATPVFWQDKIWYL